LLRHGGRRAEESEAIIPLEGGWEPFPPLLFELLVKGGVSTPSLSHSPVRNFFQKKKRKEKGRKRIDKGLDCSTRSPVLRVLEVRRSPVRALYTLLGITFYTRRIKRLNFAMSEEVKDTCVYISGT
jgi:hypothetical protein